MTLPGYLTSPEPARAQQPKCFPVPSEEDSRVRAPQPPPMMNTPPQMQNSSVGRTPGTCVRAMEGGAPGTHIPPSQNGLSLGDVFAKINYVLDYRLNNLSSHPKRNIEDNQANFPSEALLIPQGNPEKGGQSNEKKQAFMNEENAMNGKRSTPCILDMMDDARMQQPSPSSLSNTTRRSNALHYIIDADAARSVPLSFAHPPLSLDNINENVDPGIQRDTRKEEVNHENTTPTSENTDTAETPPRALQAGLPSSPTPRLQLLLTLL